eukprot:UN01428
MNVNYVNIINRSNQAPSLRLANYVVPLCLELVFFIYLMFIVLFRAAVFFSENDWNVTAEGFVNCLLTVNPLTEQMELNSRGTEATVTIVDCGSKPDTIKMGIWFFYQALLSIVGVATFLVLGTQKIYYQLWSAVVGYYFNIPSLLVWAATTTQAKVYAKRLARSRKERNKRLAEDGQQSAQAAEEEDPKILDKVRQQEKMIKDQERQQFEEKQKKERERQQQQQTANLNMIAPHLRPMYLVAQRPRKVLPSLIDLAQQQESSWGPKPANIPDIFELFNLATDSSAATRQNRGNANGNNRYNNTDYYDDDYMETGYD